MILPLNLGDKIYNVKVLFVQLTISESSGNSFVLTLIKSNKLLNAKLYLVFEHNGHKTTDTNL